MPKTAAILDIIKSRNSCRSFDGKPLSVADKAELQKRLAGCVENPFGASVRLSLLDASRLEGKKLGTYGVIRGASLYLAGIAQEGRMDMEGFGFSMERAVLEATALGLGTCWLAGTYNRNDFKDAAGLAPSERIVCVSPVGFAAERRTVLDNLMRGAIGAAKRKPWNELFFDGSVGVPLTEQAAGEWHDTLEAVRLAPSGSNGQPWRVVKQGDTLHFYRSTGHGDITRVDMGIAACHVELVEHEAGRQGTWAFRAPACVEIQGCVYFATWVRG